MTINYQDSSATVHHGDCLTVMAGIADNSVDSIVTDPPYGLGFMGKAWDDLPPGEDWARECLRVLKPGGHLLAFGGTRTWHRLACAVEDAGFEVRDSIAWLYGSGFPKSLDVSKAIDKARDDKPEARKVAEFLRDRVRAAGMTAADIDAHLGGRHQANNYLRADLGRTPPWETWLRLREFVGFGADFDSEVWRLNGRKGTPGDAWDQREVIGSGENYGVTRLADGKAAFGDYAGQWDVTAPATDAAREWAGWGTALKPGWECAVVAQKPAPLSARIGSHLDALEATCRQHASDAARSSGPSRADSPEVTTATARESAATPPAAEAATTTATGQAASSSARMDTSLSASMAGTCSNIVRSWRACLADLCEATSTSTTETTSSTTTDLRTLWSCLSRLTHPSTLLDPTSPDGLSSLARVVDTLFAAAALSSSATRMLTATGPATSPTLHGSPAGGALSPIVVARKPLVGTVAANVLAHGTGALNIDACRIGLGENEDRDKLAARSGGSGEKFPNGIYQQGMDNDGGGWKIAPSGRWPANVILDEDMAGVLDEQSGITRATVHQRGDGSQIGYGGGKGTPTLSDGHTDTGGASRFFYVAREDKECPTTPSPRSASTAGATTSQPSRSGDSARGGAATSAHLATARLTGSPSTSATPTESEPNAVSSTPATPITESESSHDWQPAKPSQMVSPARYAARLAQTDTTTTTTSPSSSDGSADPITSSTTPTSVPGVPLDDLDARFTYVAKAPKRERPVVDGVAHPTVKPLALMRWLVRLVTPPGGTVLEPFAGSGTTVEACLLEDFKVIAIEKGDEYLPLILARIARQAEPLPEAAELVRTVDPDAAIVEQIDGQLDIFGEGVA